MLQNFLKKRKSLKRRGGQSVLGSAALSPDVDLQHIEWYLVGGAEHLVGVHQGDVVDFLATPVGEIVPNGENRLDTSLPVNSAWVEGMVVLGDGTSPNVRYLPGGGSDDTAADLTRASNQYYENTASTDLSAGNIDFTLTAWVYMDTDATDQVVVAKFSATTSSQREYRIYFTPSSDKFIMDVWDLNTGTGGSAGADDGSPIVAGQWYFVVGWHDSVNNLVGIQVNNATAVTSAWALGCTANTVDFRIGAQVDVLESWDGRIMRVGYWKSAGGGGGVLTAGQKSSLYNSGQGKSYSAMTAGEKVALVAFWGLNAASGDDEHSALATNDVAPVNSPGTAQGNDFEVAVARQMVGEAPATFTLNVDFAGSDTHPATAAAPEMFCYKISFLNADGEYGEPSDEVCTATITQGFDIAVQSIPQPTAGQDATGIRIWRKYLGSTVYQFVTDLDIGTTNYVDTVLNADLGEELVEGNTAFPPASKFTEWSGRLVGANEDNLYISNYQEPFYAPLSPDLDNPNQGATLHMQGRAAGTITGLRTHGGVVAVFTGGHGHLLTGDQPVNFRLQQFTNHGCVAHRTIVSARDLLIWLSNDGVYSWDGRTTHRISEDVQATIEAISAADLAEAHAVVFADRYYLMWPSGCLVFDLQYKVWYEYTNWLFHDSTTAEYVDGTKQRFWGAHEGHARVYQLETGNADAIPAASTPISARWASKDWDAGLPVREKRVHWIEAKFRKCSAPATATITLKRGTGETIQTEVVTISAAGHPDDTISKHEIPVVEEARDEYFRLDITVTTPAAECELLAAGLMYNLAS